MEYRGHVKNGVVILDGGRILPDGAAVNIELIERRSLNERFRNIIGRAPDLPSDMAENHDHYIHGTPKIDL